MFFSSQSLLLPEDGHNVEFKTASDSNIKLEAYGDYLYDNIVIFSSSADCKARGLFTLNLI